MNDPMLPAVLGVVVAIAITTAMDATGYSALSALPLFPLAGLFWYLQRLSPAEIGLRWGNLRGYALALAYPIGLLGLAAAIAFAGGAADTADADWNKTLTNMALLSSTGVVMVLITEEGFFRGWLWAALKRAGQSNSQVLIWTTVAFTAWHVSAVSLDTGFDLPAGEIPMYLINAALLGAVWGLLRLASGSVLVPAVSHAVWNGIDYPLFGFGEKAGALGIEQTHVYGPEVGVLGIALNFVFAAVLWFWVTKSRSDQSRADWTQ